MKHRIKIDKQSALENLNRFSEFDCDFEKVDNVIIIEMSKNGKQAFRGPVEWADDWLDSLHTLRGEFIAGLRDLKLATLIFAIVSTALFYWVQSKTGATKYIFSAVAVSSTIMVLLNVYFYFSMRKRLFLDIK